MNALLVDRTDTAGEEWFASWFDSVHYRRLYAHRNETEAAAFIDALVARLRPRPGAAVVDLGCGSGRHATRLAASGLDVTGLDLAADSIRIATPRAHGGLRFARHDMRDPFGVEIYDCVFNLFTSFGYFATIDEHLAVIGNISRSLKVGGKLVLDYLNVQRAEAGLVPRETIERDGVRYQITRWADAAHIFKRIVIDQGKGGRPLAYEERVAKFALEDFRRMFALHGMTVEETCGDYALGAFDTSSSARLVLVARKTVGDRDRDYLRERFLRMRLRVSGVTPRYDASIFCGTR